MKNLMKKDQKQIKWFPFAMKAPRAKWKTYRRDTRLHQNALFLISTVLNRASHQIYFISFFILYVYEHFTLLIVLFFLLFRYFLVSSIHFMLLSFFTFFGKVRQKISFPSTFARWLPLPFIQYFHHFIYIWFSFYFLLMIHIIHWLVQEHYITYL